MSRRDRVVGGVVERTSSHQHVDLRVGNFVTERLRDSDDFLHYEGVVGREEGRRISKLARLIKGGSPLERE